MIKRLFSFLLVALLIVMPIVPAISETDPIVGCWYIDLEINEGPNVPDFAGYVRAIFILVFEPDGSIIRVEVDFRENNRIDQVRSSVIGEWSRSGSDYTTKTVGIGEYSAYIKDSKLYSVTLFAGVCIAAHKMTSMDWYGDISAAQ